MAAAGGAGPSLVGAPSTRHAYEVTVTLADADKAARFGAYMRGKHIPEIFATGCFVRIEFAQLEPTLFRTTYVGATKAAVDTYVTEHAAAFKADFAAHFGPADATATRAVWHQQHIWGQ